MSDEEKRIDVGDENQVKQRKSKAKLAQERKEENMRVLLSDKRNREVVCEFLEAMGLFETLAYVDVQQMAIRVGRREAALWWKNFMDSVDPNAFTLMQYEAIKRKEKDG